MKEVKRIAYQVLDKSVAFQFYGLKDIRTYGFVDSIDEELHFVRFVGATSDEMSVHLRDIMKPTDEQLKQILDRIVMYFPTLTPQTDKG